MSEEKICIVGLGYIGLPLAVTLAQKGLLVRGYDISPRVVSMTNKGEAHISEPGVQEALSTSVANGRLSATCEPEKANIFVIAVPTPFLKHEENRLVPDISYIEAAIIAIAPYLEPDNLVIIESTAPVGTTDQVNNWIKSARPDLNQDYEAGPIDVNLAYCPERILPGNALYELKNNDRVIGGLTPTCASKAEALYASFVDGDCCLTEAKTAEMVKLTENACRDVQIAFANELSVICDDLAINVWELIELANRHPRVQILQPGPGVGGHCIAVDPWFIVNQSPEHAKLIQTAREINDSKPNWVVDKVLAAISKVAQLNPSKPLSEISVACLGLAFKADVADLRESPALAIAKVIHKLHAGQVVAVEPNIRDLPPDCEFALVDLEEALARSDVLVLLVDHHEFKATNPPSKAIIVDTRGVWSRLHHSIF
jgi:UDP-N-acetyl-D-mannosaminuronic acid dehydrogenase